MDEKISLKKCSSLSNLQIQNQQLPMSPTPALTSPVQREHLSLSLLTPRTRRFSCSSNSNGSGLVSPGPRLTPRINQLRQEESDVQNREANHERESISALSISQSYEDLTLVLSENWSFKNTEEFSNPLHVTLPVSNNVCSSPSPTSSRHNVIRLQYGMSPSPTRRSFATRRSMSPIAIRPSPLGSVKRKFDMMDDGNSCSSSTSSSQPYKKIFSESFSRGSSPIMSPLPICPSPDSSTNHSCETGRSTPKMFITKTFNSMTSSPLSLNSLENDTPSPSSSTGTTASSSKDLMEIGSTSGDSGIDGGSDVGSSSASDISGDVITKDVRQAKNPSLDEMDVNETAPEPSSSASIPMTIDKETS